MELAPFLRPPARPRDAYPRRSVLSQEVRGGVVLVVVLGVLLALIGVLGTISTGNVGVRTTLGVISQDPVTPGVYMKWPFISTVEEFSAKEISVDLNDLKPKAKDNLSLREMDVTVYYRAEGDKIAGLQTKYANQSIRAPEEGYHLPAHDLVFRVARNRIYEEVAKVDSLVMHTRREELVSEIQRNMQTELDRTDPGVFKITRVVVRAVVTDPSIEESIRAAVANQKKLEAMAVQTEIAKKEADIRVTEARGIAESNRIISGSLTREYLQHEANQALLRFADKGNTNTVIVPSGMSVAPLTNTGPAQK
jgi:regulator of protease activity HflC (stomatin/prohibitin superfamily)